MGTLTLDGQTVKVKDGDSIIEALEELDVPFGCQNGVCGSCYMEVLEGNENLSEPTQEEEEMGFEPPRRLGCQCKLLHGDVVIER